MTFRHSGFGPNHPISWGVPVPGYNSSPPQAAPKKNAGGKKMEAPSGKKVEAPSGKKVEASGGGKQSEHCFIAINVAGGNKQKGANKPAEGQEKQEGAEQKSDAGSGEGKKGKKNK
ncbi:hypothetical protein IWQ62_006212 [Dispira parvispora]|uniref:Uncharacterized protein n=1 Tax=Dispira parvispora TaxID=1520584 RepID=A0A9W8E3Z5_9FUNG|nr:hypothetical protein IWQ62_006212 [Dispira parvispora]